MSSRLQYFSTNTWYAKKINTKWWHSVQTTKKLNNQPMREDKNCNNNDNHPILPTQALLASGECVMGSKVVIVLMFVFVCCCLLLLNVVSCCLLLFVIDCYWLMLFDVVCCCLLLFVVVCCCLLLFVVVCCCVLLRVIVSC